MVGGIHPPDVFSLGCVIASVWLNGDPVFTLPGLLRFKDGEGEEMEGKVMKITDGSVRKVRGVMRSERVVVLDTPLQQRVQKSHGGEPFERF